MADDTLTFGQFLLSEALPSDVPTDGPLTKKELQRHMSAFAKRDPRGYVKAVDKLKRVGDQVATWEGLSVGLDDIAPDYAKRDPVIKDALSRVKQAPNDMARRRIIKETEGKVLGVTQTHPSDMTIMAKSGGRGSIAQLMKTVASPVATTDADGQVAPWLITKSYSQGLNPADAWVAGAEARRNVIASTGSVVEPGAVAKVVVTNMQNLVVTRPDCKTTRGIQLEVSDQIEDRYLAQSAAGIQAGELITPEVATSLKKAKVSKVWVRSPSTCEADHGVCQKCMGLNEWGKSHQIGTNVGTRSAQALTEPLTQFALNAKHGVRLAGGDERALMGLHGFRILTEVPKSFTERAALAQVDGVVDNVKKAPQGGWYITVGGQQHYAEPGLKPIVKEGKRVEAGDALTDGVAMPNEVVEHKGVGEGRRYLSNQLTNLYRRQGVDVDRRHVELLAKNAINYVQIEDDPSNTFIPGDVVKYDAVERALQKNVERVPLSRARGKSLGAPVLHFSAGTRITPSVERTLKAEGLSSVPIAKNGPTFTPMMKSIIQTPLLDDDWMSRLSHRYLKRTLVEGAGFGLESDVSGVNPVAAYAVGQPFGLGPDGKYAEEKTAAPLAGRAAQAFRRFALGSGKTLDELPGRKLISRWGAMDPQAWDAEKMMKWMPEDMARRVNFFDEGGSLTQEGAARFRALENTLGTKSVPLNPGLGTRNLQKHPFTKDELAQMRAAGVSMSPAEFEHLQAQRGGVFRQLARGGREVLMGEAPLRVLKQRYQLGGVFGPGGVLLGDVAPDPGALRALNELRTKGFSGDRLARLGMFGGMDLLNKGFSYGLPAYTAYDIATSDPAPGESRGSQLGMLAGDVGGWALGSPVGMVGGLPIAAAARAAGGALGAKLDPAKPRPQGQTPQQAQQQAWHRRAYENLYGSLEGHPMVQTARVGHRGLNYGQDLYGDLRRRYEGTSPQISGPQNRL